MIKINKDKNIGRVLFIVEGEKTEFSLLRKVFCDILGYNYLEQSRRENDFLEKFENKNNKYSKVAVINTEQSHISYIDDPNGFLDDLFNLLITEYNFPVDKAAIFYLFDRDPGSNKKEAVEKFINTLKDPYDNEELRGGLLLLSYPALESYITSSFQENSSSLEFEFGKPLKLFNNQQKYMINNLSPQTIKQAANELIDYLATEQIDFNLDDFFETNYQIFNKQEEFYSQTSKYKLLSLLSVAFIYLGIISFD